MDLFSATIGKGRYFYGFHSWISYSTISYVQGIIPKNHAGCQGVGICSGGSVSPSFRYHDPGYCNMDTDCPRIYYGAYSMGNFIFSGQVYYAPEKNLTSYNSVYQRPALHSLSSTFS